VRVIPTCSIAHWYFSPKRQEPKASTSPVAQTTLSPLAKPAAIAELPFFSSSQLSTTRTQGSSSDCSNAYVGDFRQVIVGVRASVQVRFIVSDYAALNNLQVTIVAWLRADVVLGHPEHLAKIVGLRIV
jgi:Phage capsid family